MNWRELSLRIGLAGLSISVSLALTALLILLLGSDPQRVLTTIVDGAFRDQTRLGSVINFWIPLTLAATGLVITFTAGLWNIGVEGQMMMGAIFASYGAQFIALPQPLLIPVCLLLGATGGLAWALLAGILKTRAGVNEIFGGVALNALANLAAIYLIAGPWEPPEGGSAQSTAPFPAEANLPVISPEFPVSLVMLVLTLAAAVGVLLLLNRTRLGLELKATGKNARSALLLGVPTERTALLAFALCGLLAGLAGSHRVLHTYQSLRPLVSGGIGFLGLLAVLLVSYRMLILPLITFALAALIAGSTRVKVLLQLDQSLVGVLQGLLVLTVLLFNGARERFGGRARPPAP
ncbi:MAG: ABC transporter permease [Anaerolineae bacterium]|jgi:simple sugar transport system permease protein|nr:ABC transporter permease [Anaerolineae bacterium]